MKLLNHTSLHSGTERAKKLIHIAKEAGRTKDAGSLATLLAAITEERFTLGVIGQAKRGKSTLINGLLGRADDKVAPVGRAPTTSVVSVFTRSEKEEGTVTFKSGGQCRSISFDQVQSYTTEDENPENQKAVASLHISGPFPGLEKGVQLVDTPGSDNAMSTLHDAVLLNFLPKADALIFMVSADEPLTQSEMDLLKQVRKSDASKILFVINKVDRVDADELEECLAHNKKILSAVGFGDARIFCISAKNYFLKKSDAGTEALLAEVRRMIVEERLDILAKRLADRTTKLAEALHQDIDTELQWAEKTEDDLKHEQHALAVFQKELVRERPKAEKALLTQCADASKKLRTVLDSTSIRMTKEYTTLIEETALLEIDKIATVIPSDIVRRSDEYLATTMREWTDTCQSALATYTTSYQQTCINAMGSVPQLAITPGDAVKNTGALVLTALPGVLGAFAALAIPGMVSSAIMSVAPTVVVATLNPFTWVAAAGTGVASGTLGLASGAAAVILAPVALIGGPLLLAYAGYRVWDKFNAQKMKAKNELITATNAAITAYIGTIRAQIEAFDAVPQTVINDLNTASESKLIELEDKLEASMRNKPSADKIGALKTHRLALEAIKQPA